MFILRYWEGLLCCFIGICFPTLQRRLTPELILKMSILVSKQGRISDFRTSNRLFQYISQSPSSRRFHRIEWWMDSLILWNRWIWILIQADVRAGYWYSIEWMWLIWTEDRVQWTLSIEKDLWRPEDEANQWLIFGYLIFGYQWSPEGPEEPWTSSLWSRFNPCWWSTHSSSGRVEPVIETTCCSPFDSSGVIIVVL